MTTTKATRIVKTDDKVLKVLLEFSLRCNGQYTQISSPTQLCRTHNVNSLATRACIELGFLAKAKDVKLYLWKVGAPTEDMAEQVTDKIKAIKALNNYNSKNLNTLPPEFQGRKLVKVRSNKPTQRSTTKMDTYQKYLKALLDLYAITNPDFTALSIGTLTKEHGLGAKFANVLTILKIVEKRPSQNNARIKEFKWIARCAPTMEMARDCVEAVNNNPVDTVWCDTTKTQEVYKPHEIKEGSIDKMTFVDTELKSRKEEMFLRALYKESHFTEFQYFSMRKLTTQFCIAQRAGIVALQCGLIETAPLYEGHVQKKYKWIAGPVDKRLTNSFRVSLQKDSRVQKNLYPKPKKINKMSPPIDIKTKKIAITPLPQSVKLPTTEVLTATEKYMNFLMQLKKITPGRFGMRKLIRTYKLSSNTGCFLQELGIIRREGRADYYWVGDTPNYKMAEELVQASVPKQVVEKVKAATPIVDEKDKRMSIAKKLIKLGDLDGAEKVLDGLIEQE